MTILDNHQFMNYIQVHSGIRVTNFETDSGSYMIKNKELLVMLKARLTKKVFATFHQDHFPYFTTQKLKKEIKRKTLHCGLGRQDNECHKRHLHELLFFGDSYQYLLTLFELRT